ncbi:hypothetical protein ACD661_01475 [Legionella lytica]|uniref:Effector protein B, substrate of the Dot/Icm secretion system n=1 Tax=Legionella lytica TaxID=96232 RepID=A0ABW8D6T2_9GAMM
MTDKKLDIVASTIEQDQQTVASQWANTFLHNNPNDVGTQIMQLLSACVAAGDFKTRSAFSSSNELQAPNDQLTIADYLSHASRIILDYEGLSEAYRAELLSYFPAPGSSNAIFSRSATHNVYRKDETIAEGKGVLIGLRGQLPTLFNTPRDFGVNIAMGGEGKQNFYGKKISDNGFSGHVYFHKNEADHLLMVGLEQSAPAASILELFTGHPEFNEEEQQHSDQFGQGHSLTGASDVYTAAASLYFSDPVYQAKLILEKGCFPPEKYGAMQVTLTDGNWPAIKSFLEALKQGANKKSEDELVQRLLQKPVTASPQKQEFISYIALDFKTYFQRIYTTFIKNSSLEQTEQLNLHTMQNDLLELIKKLQNGDHDSYEAFLNLVAKITDHELIPTPYKEAIARVGKLFDLQLSLDSELKNIHGKLMLNARYEELQEERNELIQKLAVIKQYFESEYINKDQEIYNFLGALGKQLDLFLQPEDDSVSITETDLGLSVIITNPVSGITAEKVAELDQQIQQCRILLSQTPKLHSQAAMNEQHELLGQEKENRKQLEQEFADYKLQADAALKQQQQMHVEEQQKLVEANLVAQQELASKHLEVQKQLTDEYLEERQKLQAVIQNAQQQYERLLKQGEIAQARMARIAPILSNIENLEVLRTHLAQKGPKSAQAEVEAGQLISELRKIIGRYNNNPTENEEEALADFKHECTNELLKPRAELDKHESYRRIISNILLALSLLIVGYVVAAGVNRVTTGRYTFFNSSASALIENVAGLTIKSALDTGKENELVQEPGSDLLINSRN